jgi:hypothetical protein
MPHSFSRVSFGHLLPKVVYAPAYVTRTTTLYTVDAILLNAYTSLAFGDDYCLFAEKHFFQKNFERV